MTKFYRCTVKTQLYHLIGAKLGLRNQRVMKFRQREKCKTYELCNRKFNLLIRCWTVINISRQFSSQTWKSAAGNGVSCPKHI